MTGIDSLAQANPTGLFYIKGSAEVEGSRRIVIDDLTGFPEIEVRINNVWNAGGMQIAQGSLLLGSGVRLSALGHHLLVTNLGPRGQQIALDQSFDESGTGAPETPIMGPLTSRVIIQPDNTTELILTEHTSPVVVANLVLCTQMYIQIGSVAASADVRVVFSEGIPPDDIVFFKQNFSALKFPANTEVIIETPPGINFDPAAQLNAFFTSPEAFAMRYNATSTALWFALDVQQQSHEDLLTESLTLSNDLSICFSNELELTRPNFVFT